MTQKEELLVKLHEAKNELNKLTDNDYRWNVEELLESGYFSRIARKETVDTLKNKLDVACRSIENKKNAIRRQEYLKTEEGQAKLAEIKEKSEELSSKYISLKFNTEKELLGLLAGTGFSVFRLGDRCAELTTGTHQFNTIDVYFDSYSFGNEGPRFEIGVGSTGSFELGSDRASFYVALGNLLASPNIGDIKSLLIAFGKQVEEIDKESSKLRDDEENLGCHIC